MVGVIASPLIRRVLTDVKKFCFTREESGMMIGLTNYHNYDKIMIIYKGGIVYDSNQTYFGLEK